MWATYMTTHASMQWCETNAMGQRTCFFFAPRLAGIRRTALRATFARGQKGRVSARATRFLCKPWGGQPPNFSRGQSLFSFAGAPHMVAGRVLFDGRTCVCGQPPNIQLNYWGRVCCGASRIYIYIYIYIYMRATARETSESNNLYCDTRSSVSFLPLNTYFGVSF
jgi:hypothetical protein